MSLPLNALPASAAAALTITPTTSNVVGLDGNDVSSGPNRFPSGARVCNAGDDTATNVTKAATVETGAEIQVPLFIKEGEKLRIDTCTVDYVERVNS